MGPVLYEEVQSRTLLQHLAVPSLPYRWTANPYRGCQHPCAYCYAQGKHRYSGYSGGEAFEQRVVVKMNAAAILREELLKPTRPNDLLGIGASCDPYQPAELKYRITQQLLSVCVEQAQPCVLTTRSTLVLRDLELLKALALRAAIGVVFSLCTLDTAVWRHVEADSSLPLKRLEVMERLAAAGVPVGVLLAPILPDLTDHPAHLELLVRAASEHGAQFLAGDTAYLRPGSREWYLPALRAQYPHLFKVDPISWTALGQCYK